MGLLCITAEFLRQYLSDSPYERAIGVAHPFDSSIARTEFRTCRQESPRLCCSERQIEGRAIPSAVKTKQVNFSAEMDWIDDMVRPCIRAGRDSSACRLVGRPHSPWQKYNAICASMSSARRNLVVSTRLAWPSATPGRRLNASVTAGN
jgi:hypothetical protein